MVCVCMFLCLEHLKAQLAVVLVSDVTEHSLIRQTGGAGDKTQYSLIQGR